MEKHRNKSTGISLLLGALLIIATMVLHPSGGSLERIVQITGIIMVSHALAITSLPFVFFGFYGLSKALPDRYHLNQLALIIVGVALMAAMFAALFNGLVLPYFLGQYADNLEQNAQVLRPIANFSFSINKPLDYIFIAGICAAIEIYSLKMLKDAKWIGYLGIAITVFAIIGAITGFAFISLTGFRIFTFSVAAWVLASGVWLMRKGS